MEDSRNRKRHFTILLAVDGSAHTSHAVEQAVQVASKWRAQVWVLHVLERTPTVPSVGLGYEPAMFSVEDDGPARTLVARVVQQLQAAGIEAQGEVDFPDAGGPAPVIIRHAVAHQADLIVMGSRGISDLAGLVLGSVTHKVLHLAEAPVLVVPLRKHQRHAPAAVVELPQRAYASATNGRASAKPSA